MSNTQSAHVCTSNWLNETEELSALATAQTAQWPKGLKAIYLSGSGQLMPDNSDRRFFVIEEVAPSDVPPPGALLLDEVLLPQTALHKAPKFIGLDCTYYAQNAAGETVCTERHHDEISNKYRPERIGKWRALLFRKDDTGREWSRTAICVMDDHGWLVEV